MALLLSHHLLLLLLLLLLAYHLLRHHLRRRTQVRIVALLLSHLLLLLLLLLLLAYHLLRHHLRRRSHKLRVRGLVLQQQILHCLGLAGGRIRKGLRRGGQAGSARDRRNARVILRVGR